jgi:L-asparaginase II
VQGILERIGLGAEALQCGAHAPYHEPSALALGGKFTVLHSNCSGKHAGMLAAAVASGWDARTYLHPDHPVQRAVREILARATGLPPERLLPGTDGCSAPNYAMPVSAAARLFGTLARPEVLTEPWASALARIRDAMMRHPEMVAGTDRFDTALMESAEGRLVAKVGGEAVFGVADVESGLGFYVKVEDGGVRAVPPVTIECLRQLGWLEGRAFEVLGEWWRPPVRNVAGWVVGRVEPVVQLETAVELPPGSSR